VAETFDTIVIGGGIAGVSALAELARHGSALLLEQEPSLAAHASGRNAALYRPLERDETTAALARRSLEILRTYSAEPMLRPVGMLLASGDPAVIDAEAVHASALGVPHSVLSQSQCGDRVTLLRGGDVHAGLMLPTAGVLDIHRMITTLAGVARDRGAKLRQSAQVLGIEVESGRARGVRLADGTRVAGNRVVVAAGAWGNQIARECGSRVQLVPERRHLMLLRAEGPPDPHAPVVWRLEPRQELYFRPESGGYLASPCDATVAEPHQAIVDPDVLEQLADKLGQTAPPLAQSRVSQVWACLRTFAPDRELVLGADPALESLYWFGGLGGRGMAVAVAAAEALGTLVAISRAPEFALRMSPSRY